MLLNSVATTRPGTGLVLAEAVDFDGANDYLSRSSDLTGNADGKTFTFSAWVWRDNTSGLSIYNVETGQKFKIYLYGDNNLYVYALNSSGTGILSISGQINIELRTWNHILISVDLANASNRYVYVNDTQQTGSLWSTYTNNAIDFTGSAHFVGATSAGYELIKGRLAHVFIDYQYRDLSIEANRRLFITSDRKPVNKSILTALNPILYLPMDDPSTAHVNAGTGGNFTLNGTIARSGRGPNQFNVPYSDLDGAADYLSKTTALTGIADSKTVTVSFTFNPDAVAGYRILTFGDGASNRFIAVLDTDGTFYIQGWNSAGTSILKVQTTSALVIGRNYHIVLSLNLADSGQRGLYVNGQSAAVTWTTYTDDTIDLAYASPVYRIGATLSAVSYNGRLGNVFFHTQYIDLSVAANLAKFVTGTGIDAKPVDMGANGELPLGVQPLIYLPMYGNNAGKNYGSGGDFTVNSGPYPGARGPNEFFGNKADFDGSTGKLTKASALSMSDSNKFSVSFAISADTANRNIYTVWQTSTNYNLFYIKLDSYGRLEFYATDNTGLSIGLAATCNSSITGGTTYYVQACFDLSDTGKRYVYLNGNSEGVTWNTYTNKTIDFTDLCGLGVGAGGASSYFDGRISEFYFAADYIDFSQESNRLKFRDAFGNPVDLTPQIQAGTLPNPAIYMRFDPADQGKNSGTGGNFTKTGTIADGGQL